MPIEIGRIEALYRYPVKSMHGESLSTVELGWHGLDGDRRLAFRRLDDRSGFPWLSASKLPELVAYAPRRPDGVGAGAPPTHVRTPQGEELPLFGEALAAEVGRKCGLPVEMAHLRQGVFDDASISVIASETVDEISRLAGVATDVRRFRPNIVLRCDRAVPFVEDQWLGGVLRFGDGDDAPAVSVTVRDLRCVMINFDPDSGHSTPELMKAAVRANQNHAGVYGTVTRIGSLAVGQVVTLHR